MRSTLNFKITMGDESRRLMVPGELSFKQLYSILTRLFGIEEIEDHYFKAGRLKGTIGPFYGDEPEEHRYISGCIGHSITCFSDIAEIHMTWLKGTVQEKDCPVVTKWSGGTDRTSEINTWLEDEYYLLAEVDGNPMNKRNIYTDEIREEIGDAFLSPKKLTFYEYLQDSTIFVLEKDDEYRKISKKDVEKYNDDFILIRPADKMYIFEIASEYSGTMISDIKSYKKFESEHEDDSEWNLFRKRRLREILRGWVKDNDIWIDLCDLDALLEETRHAWW